jgi:hypothetical protein
MLFLNLAGQPDLRCSVTVQDHGDHDIRVGAFLTLAALVLFSFADYLAVIDFFILLAGGLMGVTGGTPIAMFFQMR